MDQQSSVIRLSLRWLVIGFLLMFAIGILGGIFGTSLTSPRTPLTRQQDQLITTVQEVTLSPSIVTQDLVRKNERSVLSLAQGTIESYSIIGNGLVVTNDGLVVGFHAPTRSTVFALDSSGNTIGLDVVGNDTLYGLTYYRIQSGVIAPLSFAQENPGVGATVTSLSRDPDTLLPRAEQSFTTTTTLAESVDPAGWQQLGLVTGARAVISGAAMLDDSGNLRGMYLGTADADTGRMLFISDIRSSLNRVTSGKREVDPFERLGFSTESAITFSKLDNQVRFRITVIGVNPASAATGILKVGDEITAVGDTSVTIATPLATLIPLEGPTTLDIKRGGTEQTVTLNAN